MNRFGDIHKKSGGFPGHQTPPSRYGQPSQNVYAHPQTPTQVQYGASQPTNNLPYGLTPGQSQPSAFGLPQPGYQIPQGPTQPDCKPPYQMEQPNYSQGPSMYPYQQGTMPPSSYYSSPPPQGMYSPVEGGGYPNQPNVYPNVPPPPQGGAGGWFNN